MLANDLLQSKVLFCLTLCLLKWLFHKFHLSGKEFCPPYMNELMGLYLIIKQIGSAILCAKLKWRTVQGLWVFL